MPVNPDKMIGIQSDLPEQPFSGDDLRMAAILLSASDAIEHDASSSEMPKGPVYKGGTTH